MKFIRSLSRNSSHGFQQTFTSLSILSRVFFSDFLQGFLLKLFWKYFRIFFRKIILDFRSSARTPFTRNKYTLKIYPDYSLYFSQKAIPESYPGMLPKISSELFCDFFLWTCFKCFFRKSSSDTFRNSSRFFWNCFKGFLPKFDLQVLSVFFFKDSPGFF